MFTRIKTSRRLICAFVLSSFLLAPQAYAQLKLPATYAEHVKLYLSRLKAKSTMAAATSSIVVPAQDSLALVSLYNSTGGNAWTRKDNWLTGRVETWYGIQMAGNRVGGVILPSNNLNGNLPAAFANLTACTYVALNGITGTLPDLRTMTVLGVLDLRQCHLTGSFPALIPQMPSIWAMSMDGSSITGSLPDLSSLVNLEIFTIENNQLSGSIPASITTLPKLRWIGFTGNQLTGTIPAQIGNLKEMQNLLLGTNQLTGSIPTGIGQLKKLAVFYVNNNNLTGDIPAEMADATALVDVFLNNNKLTSNISVAWEKCTSLARLQMNNNLLVSITNFANHPNKASLGLGLQNNKLDFGDLEPLFSGTGTLLLNSLTYSPQDSLDAIISYTDNQISSNVSGTKNTYQWLKDGAIIAGATAKTLNFTTSDYTANRQYQCRINNTAVGGLTLATRKKFLQAIRKDTSTFQGKSDYILQYIDKSKIPTQILYDRVFPMAGLDFFNQATNDTSSYTHFIQSYSEIYYANYQQNSLPSPGILKNLVLKNRNDNNIPLALMRYAFNIIDTLSIANNLFVKDGDFLRDVAGRASSPYLSRKLLVIAPMSDYLNIGTVIFKLPLDLLWQNTAPSVTSVQITAGDVANTVTITPGTATASFSYTTSGVKIIKFVITFSDNSTKITYARINVAN